MTQDGARRKKRSYLEKDMAVTAIDVPDFPAIIGHVSEKVNYSERRKSKRFTCCQKKCPFPARVPLLASPAVFFDSDKTFGNPYKRRDKAAASCYEIPYYFPVGYDKIRWEWGGREIQLGRLPRSMKTRQFTTRGAKPLRVAGFFLLIFAYLFLLGRIGMPLAHDFFDPLVMRDTCLVVPALLDRGASLITLLVEAMKHLEGPGQFALMNSYCLLIRDTFPLTPTTMQFPNTVLACATCLFVFLLIRRLFDLKLAYCTVTAFVLTPWIAYVIRLTQYFNMLSLLFHFSTAYFLSRLMMDRTSHFWRVMAPLSLALYFWSSLDWPSYVLFLGLFCIFSRKWSEVLRNPYNALIFVALAPLLAWDILLYTKFGIHGLAYTRLLYPLAISSKGASSATLSSIWANHAVGWGPLMAVSFGGLVYYLLSERSRLSSDSMARGFLDACGLWLVWATVTVLLAADHRTYLYVLGMPAAAFSGLAFSKVPIRALVGLIVALGVFQIGVVTDWGFGAKTDERRRVLAAASFLIEYRPDLLAADKTLMAVEYRRGGEKGLGGAVAQYARPQKLPVVVTDHFPVTGWLGRGAGPGGAKAIRAITEEYEKHGRLNVDGVILESRVLSKENPARKFWLRVVKDPNIRWLARFKEESGEIFVGEIARGKGASLERSPLMDVKTLSDRYLEKYDRFSYLKRNLEHARLYFTSILSK